MTIKTRLKNLIYGKTVKKINEKYKKNKYNFDVDIFTERELKCIILYGGIPPSKYNRYEPLNDLDFLLEVRRTRSPSGAQLSKKKALNYSVKKFLSEQRFSFQ